MKPFILEFAEIPNEPELDFSGIEYSEKLNLNILSESGTPAILIAAADTMTGTYNQNEVSDADPTRSNSSVLLDTGTHTRVLNEISDSEPTRMMNVLDTMTGTKVLNEIADDDRNFNRLYALMDTATTTNSQNSDLEVTDTDKAF